MKYKILLILIFLSCGHSLNLKATESTVIMGTGFLNKLYFLVGGTFCQAMNARNTSFKCLVQKTDGEIENVWGLKDGLFDIAFVGKDTAEYMYRGNRKSEIEAMPSLRLVLPLYMDKFLIITSPQSKINTLNDLKGKKIDIGMEGSESYIAFKNLTKIKGWTDSDFEKIYTSDLFGQKNKLLKNEADAIVTFEGSPSPWVLYILQSYPGHILSIDAQDVSTLNSEFKSYVPTTLDAKTYPNNDFTIQTFGREVYLVAPESTSPEIVYTFLKTLDENMFEIKNTHPVLKNVYTYNIKIDKPAIPLHIGAERYLIERKIL